MLDELRRRLHRRSSWHPTWSIPRVAIECANSLGASNASALAVVLGATMTAPGEMRLARNFLVHREMNTATALTTGLGVSSTSEVLDLVFGAPYRAGATRFEYWLAELELVAEALVQ
jgi:hypothetical protein